MSLFPLMLAVNVFKCRPSPPGNRPGPTCTCTIHRSLYALAKTCTGQNRHGTCLWCMCWLCTHRLPPDVAHNVLAEATQWHHSARCKQRGNHPKRQLYEFECRHPKPQSLNSPNSSDSPPPPPPKKKKGPARRE